MKRLVSVISLVAFLASCGHLVNPAPPKAELTSGRDRNASCADINAEILHLQGERAKAQSQLSTQTGQNIAATVGGILLLFPVVFLDVTTDKSEAHQSYVFREEYLRKLGTERSCPDLPGPYQGPFNQPPNTAFVPSGGNVLQTRAGSAGAVPVQPKPIAEPMPVAEPKAAAARIGLLQSSKTGDVEGIKAALADGAWINQKDDNGDTALMIAVYSGKPEAVDYLCRNGADVNDRNLQNATALIYSAYYNQVDAAKVLLGFNPDRTVRDKYKNTALDYAHKYGYGDVASLLKAEEVGSPGPAATGSGMEPVGSESTLAAVARAQSQNDPASPGAAFPDTARKEEPVNAGGPPTPAVPVAPVPVPPSPRVLTTAEIRDLLLRPDGWEGTWTAPGRVVTGDFRFASRGEKVVAGISIVDRPFIDRACERDVVVASEVVTFENCVNTEITLRFDPDDPVYPFKGKGSNGSDYKFREK